MAVSCAVYNLPSDFPLLDVKIENVSLAGREILDCCDDFSFQDFNPIAQQPPIDPPAIDNPQKDPSFTLIDPPAPGFQPAFLDGYGGGAAAAPPAGSMDSHQDSKPLFDLWEVPDPKKDSIASFAAPGSSSCSSSSSRLVEWIGEVPPGSVDWQHHNPAQSHGPEESAAAIAATASATAAATAAVAAMAEEQYWFTCPQLECQVLQPQPPPIPGNLYAFRRHCPAAMLDNLMVSSPPAIDPGAAGGSGGGGVLDHRPIKAETTAATATATTTQQQQQQEQHFHGGFLPPSDRSIKIDLPLRSTARKCRMARKRRSLPYQVPFPCCTSRKSVKELIAEKNLEFLLQKELKPSDVGNLGRIVLPKKEAESCLPYLAVREGMTIVMEDLTTAYKWHMRYRFWPNNKSRMYLLENTGEFIRSHCLKEGDLLRLYKYRDSPTAKYVILGKKAVSEEDSSTSSDTNNNGNKRTLAAKSNTRKRSSKSCSSSSRSNKAVSRGSIAAAEAAGENSNSNSNSNFSSSVSSRAGSTSSSSFGSSENGLANFDSFEASDIQEILTSLS